LPSSQFLDAITSPQMSARLAELKTLSPEIETLYYILGPERFLEWAHSVGVATDAQLRAASAAIPPQTLRSLVAAPSVSVFLWTGLRDAANFLRLYQKHADTKDCVKVLDFGCGCGRMTRFLRAIPWLKVHGTDVNPALAEWCRRNLDRVRTEVNKPIPPLAYSSMEFKLVYSCSIFTHLPELSALQWLGEIQRILAPKGIAILTTHGYMALDIISSSELHQQMFNVTSVAATDIRSRLASEGFIYLRYGDETLSVAKAGNDYGNSFTHENYIRSKWASFGFQVLEYIPGGMRGWQDITVLRKQ